MLRQCLSHGLICSIFWQTSITRANTMNQTNFPFLELNTVERRYNAHRYSTRLGITWQIFGPQISQSLNRFTNPVYLVEPLSTSGSLVANQGVDLGTGISQSRFIQYYFRRGPLLGLCFIVYSLSLFVPVVCAVIVNHGKFEWKEEKVLQHFLEAWVLLTRLRWTPGSTLTRTNKCRPKWLRTRSLSVLNKNHNQN